MVDHHMWSGLDGEFPPSPPVTTKPMTQLRQGLTLLIACALFLPFGTVSAQVTDEVLDEWFTQLEAAVRKGKDARALLFGERLLKEDSSDTEVLSLLIEPAMNSGRWESFDRYLAQLTGLGKTSRELDALKADSLIMRGRLEEAEAILRPLAADRTEGDGGRGFDLDARRRFADLLRRMGRLEESKAQYETILQMGKSIVLKDTLDLVAYAEACEFVGGRSGLRQAEKDLALAQKQVKEGTGKKVVLPSLRLGWLYLKRFYLPGDAVEEFKAALEIRPSHVDALWGLHQAYSFWQKSPLAEKALKDLLKACPTHPEGLAERAGKLLGDMSLEEADRHLEQGLSTNPEHPTCLALKALHALFAGQLDKSKEWLAKARAVPGFGGRAHLVMAGVLNERRRWPEALEQMREAVKADPDDPLLWDMLARFAFFLGLEDEGKAALKKADGLDVFTYPWRTNMFEVVRVLDSFYQDTETAHFYHRFHRKERAALNRIVSHFCEHSYEILTKRYAFDPGGAEAAHGKLLVEWFRNHQGFSVRTLGMQHLGATGVCFGPFICMDSPGSREPGEFSWARTFHHELAHTMTLGLSKGRVPRWLTEGLSTFEEIRFDSSWDRGMYRDLYNYWKSGDLLKVLEFDAAFSTSLIGFAYFQGGLVSRYMTARFGWPKVLEVLKAYGEDRGTDEILNSVLKVTAKEFDEGFSNWVGELLRDVKLVPFAGARELDELVIRWREDPENDEIALQYGLTLAQTGAAFDALSAFASLDASAQADPRYLYAQGLIAKVQGKTEAHLDCWAKALEAGLEDYDIRLALGNQDLQGGELEQAREHFEKAVQNFPFASGASDPRLILAKMAKDAGDTEAAVHWAEEHLNRTFENLKVRDELIAYYQVEKKVEDLERHLRAKIFIYPLGHEVHEELGRLLFEQGRKEEAVLPLLTAVDVLSEVAHEPEQLAALHAMAGQALLQSDSKIQLAAEHYRKALALAPDLQEVKALAEILKEMGAGVGR